MMLACVKHPHLWMVVNHDLGLASAQLFDDITEDLPTKSKAVRFSVDGVWVTIDGQTINAKAWREHRRRTKTF